MEDVTLFAQMQLSKGLSNTSIAQALAPISWALQMSDKPDPTKHKIIWAILVVAKKGP